MIKKGEEKKERKETKLWVKISDIYIKKKENYDTKVSKTIRKI